MNRQFQNYQSNDEFSMNSRNMTSGNKHMYMERPTNLSQEQYSKNQGQSMEFGRNQLGAGKQVYNPNPFNGNDMASVSSQMGSMINTESAVFQPNRSRSEPESSNSNDKKKELGVLFYSNNCDHSKTFITNLMKTKLNDFVRKICVDGNNVKIPSVVKSVPTLIARGINRPLVGDQVFAWLENEISKSAVADNSIKCFSFNCKDNYTFINDVDDSVTIDSNVAEWDKDYSINAPIDTDSTKNSKKIDQGKVASYKNDVSKLRDERNSMLKPPPKNASIDPDQFNQMFIKQQEKSRNPSTDFKQKVRNI
jgi:hypothetical protein